MTNQTILLILLTVLMSLSLNAQSDSLKNKVVHMMKIMGTNDRMQTALDQMIDLQKQTNPQMFDEKFWSAYKKEIMKDDFKEFNEVLIPIYLKYLKSEDIDHIIQFYKSDAGQNLKKHESSIMKESMEAGAQIGEEISLRVLKKLESTQIDKFNTVVKDCKGFRKGQFTSKLPNGLDLEIIRTKEHQIEKVGTYEQKYKIDWIDNCKYTLKPIDEDGTINANNTITANIFEIDGNICKYISTNENQDLFDEGEIIKKE